MAAVARADGEIYKTSAKQTLTQEIEFKINLFSYTLARSRSALRTHRRSRGRLKRVTPNNNNNATLWPRVVNENTAFFFSFFILVSRASSSRQYGIPQMRRARARGAWAKCKIE